MQFGLVEPLAETDQSPCRPLQRLSKGEPTLQRGEVFGAGVGMCIPSITLVAMPVLRFELMRRFEADLDICLEISSLKTEGNLMIYLC
jgi:hypothetical protein